MKNYNESVETDHNLHWSYIHRMLIIGGSGLGKTNVLLNLIKYERPDIYKIIYTSKIPLNESINYLLMEGKK